ncbi:uncharacterized protein [Dermacentor albipictus]|uniref:uncharacterized protein n=1 Tax=Dermacentor albipictus TaxID=60249 RepID=UPI0038FD332E
MRLRRLLRDELLNVGEELGLDVRKEMLKSELLELISDQASEEEIEMGLELLKTREIREREREERDREKREREERDKDRELRKMQLELESKRLELSQGSEGALGRSSEAESYRMDRVLKPFEVGTDMGLFLCNFERTCEKMNFGPRTWPQRLLSMLPCEAAEVNARLSARLSAAYDYAKVKASLLKKYRLSAEAFRQSFRSTGKKDSEGYPEFAYGLKANPVEWLKSVEAYDSRDMIIECLCLEQFYKSIPQAVKLWVQDRGNVNTVERAAELAEEYATRRNLNAKDGNWDGRSGPRKPFPFKKGSQTRRSEPVDVEEKPAEKSEEKLNGETAQKEQKRKFESFKPIRCYKCHKLGHIAVNCRKPSVVFSYVEEKDENIELLSPYLQDLQVNGKPCRVLRDTAAMMDIVHPSYVTVDDFTPEVAWIKQFVDEHSVCLPRAKVNISGPFGELETEAAVSKFLSLQYPYIFSNRSNQLLRDKGLKLGEGMRIEAKLVKSRRFRQKMHQLLQRKQKRGELQYPNPS